MPTRCFLLLPTDHARVQLRRYVYSSVAKCPQSGLGYHNAHSRSLCNVPMHDSEPDADGHRHWVYEDVPDIPHDDPRWPSHCRCGYAFTEADEWQVWVEPVYRRQDTMRSTTLRDAPPGAMWFADWMSDFWKGTDGRCVVVKLPNGNDWVIDAIAHNCDAPCLDCGKPLSAHMQSKPTIPCRKMNPKPHNCWVRHGEPPNLTVDKKGVTCGAGAGSIQSGNYHGFLIDGVFNP